MGESVRVELEQELIEKLDQISFAIVEKSMEISNPTNFRLLGKGNQGAVFQIDAERCVKIYYRQKKDLEKELHNLLLGNIIGICPKVFLWGEDYIIMEYISAPSLEEYLEKNPLTKEMAARIIELLDSLESIGFNRLDHAPRHIYLLPAGKLKVIDVCNSISKTSPLPVKLMEDMGAKADDFLQFVQEISPKWYQKWTNHPDFPLLRKNGKQRG